MVVTVPVEHSQIFIGGCERSGTTLLGSLIGHHPSVLCTPEANLVKDIYYPLKSKKKLDDYASILSAFKSSWRINQWGIDLENLTPKTENGIFFDAVYSLLDGYSSQITKKEWTCWVDHTPLNMKYALVLADIFPASKFIHIVRDGRGVSSSVMKLEWGPNDIESAAKWWVERIAYGLAAEHELSNKRIIRVSYEDILEKPEETIRDIFYFIGLAWDKSLLNNAAAFKVPNFSQQQHSLIGKGLDISRADSWISQLTDREIEIFELLSGEMLDYIGFKRCNQVGALCVKPVTRVERFKFTLNNLLNRKLVNAVNYRLKRKIIRLR